MYKRQAFANEKVKFIWDSVVEEIKGDDIKVRSVDIKNVKTGEVTNYEFGGVFVYVGLDPVSDYLTGLNITDQDGWVITDDKTVSYTHLDVYKRQIIAITER